MSSKIKLESDSDFGSLVQGLARDVVDAHIHWGQYKTLHSHLEKYPNVQSEAHSFWFYTSIAHHQAALTSLARALDRHKDALHMSSWLRIIKENLHLFGKDAALRRRPDDPFANWIPEDADRPDQDQLDRDIKSFSKSDHDVASLFKYRDKLLAHRAPQIGKKWHDSSVPSLTFEQVDRLLSRAQTVLNRYNYMFDASIFHMVPLGHDDVGRIFEIVQRDIDQRESEVAREASLLEQHRAKN